MGFISACRSTKDVGDAELWIKPRSFFVVCQQKVSSNEQANCGSNESCGIQLNEHSKHVKTTAG